VGAHGFTLFSVEGAGAQGDRVNDIAEYGNIQVQVIVRPEVATRLLEKLEREFFPKFAMVAYESDIRVLRQGKF
jgi:nitrogen regulatory protein P-II 2